MVRSLLDLIAKTVQASEAESKIPVNLEKSGAVQVDVETFLESTQGRSDLEKAQELWSKKIAEQG